MLLSRLSVAGAKFFGTTNPDSPYHWLKVNYLDRAGELDLRSWHFSLEDNLNLDPAYVEALKKEYVGLWYKRFILGLWVLAEGAIYDMWDDEENLFDDETAPPGLKYIARRFISIDYGTANPMVFLDIWDDGKTAWQVDEYYYDSRKTGRQKTDAQYADDLEKFIGDDVPDGIILDPSAASFRAELRQRGYRVMDADNDVLDGIRVTAAMIGRRLYRVHERCMNTRQEIASYVWDEKARERGAEQPVKVNDHACDAIRYFCKTMIKPWRLAQ
jgi:PBSX family phage terminase large subunit